MTDDLIAPGLRPDDDVDAVTSALLTASRLLVSVSARSIASVDDTITIPQLRTLVLLSVGGPTKVATLAERLAVNPSTATRMVDRLVAARLVDRRPNPTSRRELVVELTERGRRLVTEVTERRRRELAAIVSRMPPDDRGRLVDALVAFTAAGREESPAQDDHWL